MVPERLPLRGEIAIAGRDSEHEGVVLGEFLGGDERDAGGVLGGRVHFFHDVCGEGFLDLVEVGVAAGLFYTGEFGLGEGADVAVEGVLGL